MNPEIIMAAIAAVTALGTGVLNYYSNIRTKVVSSDHTKKLAALSEDVDSLKLIVEKLETKMCNRDKRTVIRNDLNEIVAESLRFTDDIALQDYLVNKATIITAYLDDILMILEGKNPDMNSIKTVAAGYVSEGTFRAYKFCKQRISEEFAEKIKQVACLNLSKFEQDFNKVLNDNMNNIMVRLGSLTILYLQENLALTIKEYNRWQSLQNNLK